MKHFPKSLLDIEQYSPSLLRFTNFTQNKMNVSSNNSKYVMYSLTKNPSEFSMSCLNSNYSEIHNFKDYFNIFKNQLTPGKTPCGNHNKMAKYFCIQCSQSLSKECVIEHKNHFIFQDISFDYNFFTDKEGIKKEFSESDYT